MPATAKKPAATAAAAKTDATVLLTRDHTEVHRLFKQYEKLTDAEASGSDRQALAEQICMLLTVHASIEEEIFYPAAREANVESDLLDEAEVEHASAKDLIAQIRAMAPMTGCMTPRSKCWANISITTSKKNKKRCSRSAARRRLTSRNWRSSWQNERPS